MNRLKNIDCLRGLSVLLVILFHLNLDIFKGGYIGVDIFFVISGFLITKVLIDYKKNKHGILFFLNKRFSRIAPPLFITVIFTLVISYFIFSLYEFKEVILFSISSGLFFSNLFYILTGNYFEKVISFSPLLHTWSLAIEMQFYFFYSIFFYLFYSEKRKTIFIFLINIICLLSLLLFVFFYYSNQTIAFYFSPFRIWEISIGIITYFLFQNIKLSKFKSNKLAMFFFINCYYSDNCF